MRVLVDAHVFDDGEQGTTTYIKGLYNNIVNCNDLEVTLCAKNIDNLKKYFTNEKFEFIQLKSNSKFYRLFFEFPNIIKNGNFDYAHFQYIVPFRKKCKYINTIHDILFLEFKKYFPLSYRLSRKFLFKLSAKKADVILTDSNYSKNCIAKYFSIKKDKIGVMPITICTSRQYNINIKEKYNLRDYILYVSRFEPRKNHTALLRAYKELSLFNNYDLVFIGRKKDKIEKAYYKEVRKYNMPNVHFFENIAESELNAFYKQAACFAYPSLAEGFGIPPLEAGINKCKVLCSNQTALEDFNFFKYRCNPNDKEDFKKKLLEILNDNEYPYEDIRKAILERYDGKQADSFILR